MKVLNMVSWENPKSIEGLKKYYDDIEKADKHGLERVKKYNVKVSSWSDGTGKVYRLLEFESYEAYAKFWDDEETQKRWVRWCRLVNNVKVKVLPESISVPQ